MTEMESVNCLKNDNQNMRLRAKLDSGSNWKKKLDSISISASRLQCFIDCPKKFYFTHIEKTKREIQLLETLRPFNLGSLEHEIIEKYLGRNKSFEQKIHQQLTNKIWSDYIRNYDLKINLTDQYKYMAEILSYSRRGIEFILKMKKTFSFGQLSFEVEFDHAPHKGRIDCVMGDELNFALCFFYMCKIKFLRTINKTLKA